MDKDQRPEARRPVCPHQTTNQSRIRYVTCATLLSGARQGRTRPAPRPRRLLKDASPGGFQYRSIVTSNFEVNKSLREHRGGGQRRPPPHDSTNLHRQSPICQHVLTYAPIVGAVVTNFCDVGHSLRIIS